MGDLWLKKIVLIFFLEFLTPAIDWQHVQGVPRPLYKNQSELAAAHLNPNLYFNVWLNWQINVQFLHRFYWFNTILAFLKMCMLNHIILYFFIWIFQCEIYKLQFDNIYQYPTRV